MAPYLAFAVGPAVGRGKIQLTVAEPDAFAAAEVGRTQRMAAFRQVIFIRINIA